MHLNLLIIPWDSGISNYSITKQNWQPTRSLNMSKRQAVKPLSGCGTSTAISHQMVNWKKTSKWRLSSLYCKSQGRCSKEVVLSVRQDLARNRSWKHCPQSSLMYFQTCKPGAFLYRSGWQENQGEIPGALNRSWSYKKSCGHQTDNTAYLLGHESYRCIN